MPQAASSDAGLAWWQRAACSVVSAGPLPRHVAFIMDGNRRWARNRGLPVAEGHRRGYAKLEESLRWCAELGVAAVTCYAFSLENFKRSAEEVDTLMALMGEKLRSMRREDSLIMTQRVRVRVVGNLARVPADVRAEIDAVTRLTSAHERAVLTVCFAYTSREEVASAVSSLAEAAAARTLCPSELTARSLEEAFRTYDPRTPPVDLLLRTSGETRPPETMRHPPRPFHEASTALLQARSGCPTFWCGSPRPPSPSSRPCAGRTSPSSASSAASSLQTVPQALSSLPL